MSGQHLCRRALSCAALAANLAFAAWADAPAAMVGAANGRLSATLAAELYAGSRVWVGAQEPGYREAGATAEIPMAKGSRDGCSWQEGFMIADLDGPVWAMTVSDDGSGPALYVGGQFTAAGGVVANNIARWDGNVWSALDGPSGPGLSGYVNALAVYDDGSGPALYAGGYFTTAGGVTVNSIARWDGSSWLALSGPSGTGVDYPVHALAVYDDGSGSALYAGGSFTTAGGVTVSSIARWDGSAWSALDGPSGTGANGAVRALAVYDDGGGPSLYAGGDFTTAGGLPVNRIARWDGSSWSALSGPSGTGVNGSVYALAACDLGGGPTLYAGGTFTSAGGVTVDSIARWDGGTWSALSGSSGTGVNGVVYALAAGGLGTGEALLVGGSFTSAGGVAVNSIARWGDSSWSALSGPSGAGVGGEVDVFSMYDDGVGAALYAGGSFTSAGGVTVSSVARWDGSSWSALSGPSGTGVNDHVSALAVYDDGRGPALYAGGWFTEAGGVSVGYVARWDGGSWSPLSGPSGTGVNDYVSALAVYDDGSGPGLYAGGWFTEAGGVSASHVARWDGSAWSALSGPGTGVDNLVSALAVYDDGSGPGLYVGGWFNSAGGAPLNHIARWDGSTWSPLSGPSGSGVNGYVYALAVYDDGSGPGLYVGGWFTEAGGMTVNHVARWDGGTWSPLSGAAGTGVSDAVYALAVYDDSAGPALYTGGYFAAAGSLAVDRIARWNGSIWSALSGPSGSGVSDSVRALVVFDDGAGATLYAGGDFGAAGGLAASHVAAWRCTADTTPPSDPTSLSSPSHAVSTWSATTQITVQWSGASDPGGLGVAGYSVVFDTDPSTVPDDSVEVVQGTDPHSTTSGLVADGQEHYFHLRTCDLAGNCSAGRHLGPFWIETVAPAPPSTLASTTHTPGVWSTDPVIGVEWSGATDSGGSGLAGYSLLFDTTPDTVPDQTVDVPQTSDPHSSESDELSDGRGHYLHLRSCDVAGSCSSALHLGPFRIDRTPPGTVGDLSSPSHPIGMPTADSTVELEWTAASDATSGVAGYGVDMSPDPTWVCDEVVDTSATTITSAALADGSWYAHVCAVDAAGSWGAVASAGPFIIDLTPATDPTSLWSPSHAVSTWSAANQITVQWSGAADPGGSGVAGYSVLFDTSPTTLPDDTIEVVQGTDPHSTTSEPVPDGQGHYFHLRSCDVAGNCSSGAHLGPFWVDTESPSGPWGLVSTSHTPGEPSWDRTVDLVWSSAVDSGSGLDGYAYEASPAASWSCDQVKDLEEGATSLTTPELADNPWYIHLCATDNLGNWGAVVTAGPYLIGAIFADGFETGDTSAWSGGVP